VLWAAEFISIKTGMWRGEVLCMYLRQNEEPGIIDHKMKMIFADPGSPADEVISGLDLFHAAEPHPRQATGRSPTKATYFK